MRRWWRGLGAGLAALAIALGGVACDSDDTGADNDSETIVDPGADPDVTDGGGG